MFWVIKIFATTLGETGGDAVTMTLKGVVLQKIFWLQLVVVEYNPHTSISGVGGNFLQHYRRKRCARAGEVRRFAVWDSCLRKSRL
jgi:hypothetical protein